ncbi:hypothetical protein FE391_25250 [Nonomuraea sp. KC401]|uniref:DUF7507 domain-containing protein n=1 Tax=unclassified Nonomuraea TaxID=2593643 RepID=UPI0010FE9436|nr:DUF11 domain-containing protein [Nonomuraea sp. KC401]NBE97096.1 hypothetical protein [Nonomuraea sp. K271]TLF66158.1 hypothetical protein FE391_25250 [Nonomuraea sp. KC401]
MALLSTLSASLLLAQPAAAQPVPLVEEDFTGATAIPEFRAVGSACLTGAPAAAEPPGPGNRPLTGCPENAAGPVPPTGAAPYGYLQLTSADNDQTSAVLYDEPISAEQGLQVTFEQWQYGTTTPEFSPADGISFFLIDGAATLDRPGAFGGSLGYAQKLPDDNPANAFEPGVNQGYVGVGLDVLGNYFGDWEQRGRGCAQRSPAGTEFRIPAPGANMVTLRGPGNGTEGYCFLTATTSNFTTTGPWPSTLPGQLHGETTTVPGDPQAAQAALEPSRRTVNVRITPAPDPVLTVSIDFNDGNGMQQVLSTPAPTPVPATYKFGFAASTGLFTDVHLIRNVVVRPVAEEPELTLVKRVAEDSQLPDPVPVGTTVPYEYEVTNIGNMNITDLTVNDDVVDQVTCPQTTLDVGETIICRGTHTVTPRDAERGSITNTATATGRADSTEVTSPESQVTIEVTGEEGALELDKSVDNSRPYRPGDTVIYRYTVTNNSPSTVADLRIDDSHIQDITCQATTLDPGAVTTCTGTFTVPNKGGKPTCKGHDCRHSITNTAVARAGDLTSAPATATIQVVQEPHHCSPGKPGEKRPHHSWTPHHGTKSGCGSVTPNGSSVSLDETWMWVTDSPDRPGDGEVSMGTRTASARG